MRNLLIQVNFETLLGSSPLPEEIQGLHGHPHAVYVIIIRQSMHWLNAVEERETIKKRSKDFFYKGPVQHCKWKNCHLYYQI